MRVLDLQFFAEGDPAPINDGGKTFTQDDVNRIVSERLSKEKGKIDTEREASYTKKEQELNIRELKLKARESLSEKNLPNELIGVLNCANEDELNKSIEILEKIYSKNQKEDSHQEPKTGFIPVIGARNGSNNYSGGVDPIKQAMGLK